jgi:hypothetical protein
MDRSIVRALAAAVLCGALASAAQATVALSDNFDSYTNGNLVGQGGWGQTGASTTNPIQVTNGQVGLTTTGQDVYEPFSSPVAHTDGSGIYTGFDVTVTSAQSAGDYFLHLSDPAGTTTNFWQRVFVKSSGSGYLLGLVDTAGTGSTVTYGTDALNLNQSYHVSLAWNFVSGLKNDTFSMYVNPSSPVEGSNTPYMTLTWTSTTVDEPAAQLSAINLRQGTASNAPGVIVDNLVVATTFAEVPEPATLVLLAAGAAFFRRTRCA